MTFWRVKLLKLQFFYSVNLVCPLMLFSLHLECPCCDGSGEQLVAETNPEQRLGVLRLQVGADVVDSQTAELRVSWTIAEEEII